MAPAAPVVTREACAKAAANLMRTNPAAREQLKGNMESQKNNSLFMHIRELITGDNIHEVAGADSGPLKNSDYSEAYMLFLRMWQEGWRIAESSPFYKAS